MKRTVSQRQDVDSDDSFETSFEFVTKEQVEAEGRTYVRMPKKAHFRMHAHINPFSSLKFDFPKNLKYVDWSVHYPKIYGIESNIIVTNTLKNPVPGQYKDISGKQGEKPSILDIGCGYGGLMF